MSTISVIGAIEFRFSVTDFDLAMKIQQLLKQNASSIVKPAEAKQGGNGHGHPRSRAVAADKKERIIKLLKDRHGTKPFHAGEAAADVKAAFGYGYDICKRALQSAVADGKLGNEKKGVYHFLESGSTQPAQAVEESSSTPAENQREKKDTTPLPAST